MPEFQMPFKGADDQKQFNDLPEFTRGYIEALFFTEATSDNPDMENATFADLSGEALWTIRKDCHAFVQSAQNLLDLAYEREYTDEQAGRDFWFTRNGHGVGFWDRRELEGELGKALTDLAKQFGPMDPYSGDDGVIYV